MVSELEKRRQENIQRNQRALREFQLRELSEATFGEPKAKPKPKAKPAKRKRDWSQPLVERVSRYRLRRLAVKPEEEEAELRAQAEQARAEREAQLEKERSRKEGELKLPELIGEGKWQQALDIFQQFGSRDSLADHYADLAEPGPLQQLTVDDRDVKITDERILAMAFHPSPSKKLVFAGDKLGELGIWDPSKEDDGVISFKNHTRAIATIAVDNNNHQNVYTGSYDGSIRKLDLSAQKSTDVFVFDAAPATARDPVGISDFSLIDPNIAYYTTLDGRFGIADFRAPKCIPRELHEKKIGGFAVNPNDKNFIATASLDRTMKVWDLRTTVACAEYSSRLSVSCASWNGSSQVVCNGYDNTINIFNMSDQLKSWSPSHPEDIVTLSPDVRLAHNCQTGRWVSILKAHWQASPRDHIEKFAIGNMKRYIDVYSGDGQLLAHLGGDIVTAVPAAIQFHPTENWIVGGTASGKVYLYT